MMILTCTLVVGSDGPEAKGLLAVDVEVNFDFRFGGFGVGREAPVTYGVLGGGGEEGVAGLDLGVRDAAVGLDGDEENDLAADMHAVGKLRIDGRDTGDDCSMDVAGEGRANAKCEGSYQEKRAGDASGDCQVNLRVQRLYRRGGEML
jgi:hypothetical protein